MTRPRPAPGEVQPPAAAAERATVTPHAGARRRRPSRPRPAALAGLLALAAAVAVAVALLVGAVRGGPHRADPAPGPGPVTAAALPAVQRSGTDYVAATLPAQVRALLAHAGPARAATPLGPALTALAGSRSALAACLRVTAGPDFGTPVAVDAARFTGSPAVVAVYPAPVRAGAVPRWQVLVIDPACSPGTFRYFTQFPR